MNMKWNESMAREMLTKHDIKPRIVTEGARILNWEKTVTPSAISKLPTRTLTYRGTRYIISESNRPSMNKDRTLIYRGNAYSPMSQSSGNRVSSDWSQRQSTIIYRGIAVHH